MEEIVSYNILFLPVSLLLTIIPFLWLRKVERGILYCFVPFLLFLFVYCGVGMGWQGCPQVYVVIYAIYMIALGKTCHSVLRKPVNISRIENEENSFFAPFVSKYSGKIVFLYILVILIGLAANGKIANVFSPPSLNLTESLDFTKSGVTGSSVFMMMYYVRNLILPFYLLALYKYKDRIILFSFLLLFPLYLDFSSNGYIARSGVMPFFIIIYVACYLRYPKQRKRIIRWTIIGTPVVLIGLSWFTFFRLGKDFDIQAGDAIKLLAFEESGYPILFEHIWKFGFDPDLCEKYIKWLVGLPLPGFLKGGDDFVFNAIFTEQVTGMSRSDQGFSVILPGLVGESVFFFGRYFFIIHAIMVGFVFSYAYKILSHKQELFLLLYCAIYGAICFCRGGTSSMMPFYFKHLIIYVIVISLLKRRKK